MLAWGFGFWMWRQPLACIVLYLISAEYSVVMCWAWPGTLVTWPWLRISMTYCFVLRLWSQICVTCRSFSVSVPLSCFVWSRCLGPVGWLHTYEMGTLVLLMTDLPDFARVAVVAPRGNSDHSSLSAVISIAHSFQTCVWVGKVSWNIKSIGILSVVQYGNCLGITFVFLTILLRFWTNIFPCWLDVMYQPRSSVCVTIW